MTDLKEMQEFREWCKTHKIVEAYDDSGDVIGWDNVTTEDIDRFGGEYWVKEIYKRQTGAATVRIF
jgi:hypothetical protein